MPDGDGFGVLRQLRAELPADTCIAAMTGYGQESDRENTLGAGFDAHLTKPVGPDQLQDVLQRAAKR